MGTPDELAAATDALTALGRVVWRGGPARLAGADHGRYRTYLLLHPRPHRAHQPAPPPPEDPQMPIPTTPPPADPEPHPPAGNPRLAAALACAARGWRVFPLRPGGKEPLVNSWESRATVDTDRIATYWTAHPDHNIGIACGPSGLVVVDCDTPKHPDDTPPERWRQPGITCGEDVFLAAAEHHGQTPADLYNTFCVRTARGGLHTYYQHPTVPHLRNTQSGIGWHVDTRAHGGYVVAPGSIVNGNAYAVINPTTPAALPDWLTRLLTTKPPAARHPVVVDLPTTDRRSRYLAAAVNRETTHVRNAAEGNRNHALYCAAVALGQLVASGALPEHAVRAALEHAAADHITAGAYTTRQRDKTITSGLTTGARDPRQVAA